MFRLHLDRSAPEPLVQQAREQVDMISEELGRRLHAGVEPILLSDALGTDRRTLVAAGACRYLVTTDFHFSEVEPLARRLGKRLLCVRLDAKIIESMLALAA